MPDEIFNFRINTPKDAWTYYAEGIVLALVGLLLGTIFDAVFTKVYRHYKRKVRKEHEKMLMVLIAFIQISVGLMFVYAMWKAKPTFANHFQTSLQGMFFPAFFFGVQLNIFASMQQYYV